MDQEYHLILVQTSIIGYLMVNITIASLVLVTRDVHGLLYQVKLVNIMLEMMVLHILMLQRL